jgi:hypothetical protein
VDGGARQYVREILSKLGPHGRTRLNEPVLTVSELGSGAASLLLVARSALTWLLWLPTQINLCLW